MAIEQHQPIMSTHVSSGQIGWPHIGNAAIASGQISSGGIGWPHIRNDGVLSGNIGSGVIGGGHFNPNDKWPGRIFSGSIDSWAANGEVLIRSGMATLFMASKQNQWIVNQDSTDLLRFQSGKTLVFQARTDGADGEYRFTEGRAGLAGSGAITRDIICSIVSGNINNLGRVDGVDISAHTHTSAAGDAPTIKSGGIASGNIGAGHNTYGYGTSGQTLRSMGPGVEPVWVT